VSRAAAARAPIGRVVALGAFILDVLGRPVESIPPGQGSVVLEEIRATAAGTAAGPAVDLAKLGAQVSAVGAIGDDVLADIITAILGTYGVDTTGLVRKPGTQTAATILPIRANGERPALHVPGAMTSLRPDEIDLDPVRNCDVLLLGAPDAIGPIATGDGLSAVTGAARAAGATIVIDVLRRGGRADFERLAGLIGAADWFCPNDDQLRGLTGRADISEAIGDVLALGTGGVAVTLGADGCLVTDADGGLLHLPAQHVDVVDTTGCGDGFDAGMIAGLLLGCGAADAARLAVSCGSLVATGLGSDAGITGLGDAIGFLRRAEPDAAARIAGRMACRPVPA
jgi:sugar/nucleoside kinase (ribokinase family)